jgi:hypothetical protein
MLAGDTPTTTAISRQAPNNPHSPRTRGYNKWKIKQEVVEEGRGETRGEGIGGRGRRGRGGGRGERKGRGEERKGREREESEVLPGGDGFGVAFVGAAVSNGLPIRGGNVGTTNVRELELCPPITAITGNEVSDAKHVY